MSKESSLAERNDRVVPGSLMMQTRVLGRPWVTAGLGLTLVLGCGDSTPPPLDRAAHEADVEAWRRHRLNLLYEEGWLALTGLYWLEEGDNAFGSGDDNDLIFPGADVPERIGVLTVQGDSVSISVAAGTEVHHNGEPISTMTLRRDGDGDTKVLTLGSLAWFVLRRQGQLGVRLRDSLAATLTEFRGLESFPLNGNVRFDARFDRYDPPKPIMVPNILGTVSEQPSPGAVVFRMNGETYRLDVTGNPADSAFFMAFADGTNGIETYGGGRFIWVDAPKDGDRMIIDFNRAYNPPCVFTPHATCPLPPRQNRLPMRIEAGELLYEGGFH